MMEEDITKCRAKIDRLDSRLLLLLNQRAEFAKRLGDLKQKANLPVCDRVREREVLIRLAIQNPGPLDSKAVIRIFLRIIRESRRLQRP